MAEVRLMAIFTTRYNHMIEFLLLRSLPVAPLHLLFYACLSACFHEIQFSVLAKQPPTAAGDLRYTQVKFGVP